MTTRDECLAAARQVEADRWGPYIARLREAGPQAMALEVYANGDRHPEGLEALERKLASLLASGKKAA